MPLRFASFWLLLFLCVSVALPAQQSPPSEPRAVAMAAQSIAALTHGLDLRDVTVTGNAIWAVGPDRESATATLIASGRSESRVDIHLDGGSRIEVRSSLSGGPEGQWTNPDGKRGLYPLHNCRTDSAWFFPALSSLANVDRRSVFSYMGSEQWNGLSVEHLRVYRPSNIASKDRTQLSAMDFYLDPGSFLPLGLSFKTHSDTDVHTDISVEVFFADYRSVNGVQVPFRIQRHVGGSVLDITVTNAIFNSAVSDDTFSIR